MLSSRSKNWSQNYKSKLRKPRNSQGSDPSKRYDNFPVKSPFLKFQQTEFTILQEEYQTIDQEVHTMTVYFRSWLRVTYLPHNSGWICAASSWAQQLEERKRRRIQSLLSTQSKCLPQDLTERVLHYLIESDTRCGSKRAWFDWGNLADPKDCKGGRGQRCQRTEVPGGNHLSHFGSWLRLTHLLHKL